MCGLLLPDCVGYLWELVVIVIWGSEEGWMGVEGENMVQFTLHLKLYIYYWDSTVQYCSTYCMRTVTGSAIKYSRLSAGKWSAAQYSTVQSSAVQYSTVQYSAVQCNAVQYSTLSNS